VKRDQALGCRVLAAAEGDDAQRLSLQILDAGVLRTGNQKEQRPPQRHRNHPQRGAALDGTDGAADGTQDINISGNAGADGEISRHPNQLAV
jgi:hypothetical protein